MNKKKLKFIFILCAIFFAFFYFNFANAETLIYSKYGNNNLGRNIKNDGVGQEFKTNNFCNITKSTTLTRTLTGTCNVDAEIYKGFFASGTPICTATATLATSGATTTYNFINCQLENNEYYFLKYYATGGSCTSGSIQYGTITHSNDYFRNEGDSVNLAGSFESELWFDETATSCPTMININDCPDCPDCETCTGSSTLVHFDFPNATTTDISRIIATSKTYTDDTGTPTSIMVSTFDIPINLFYYICMIMIMLVITIFLYFKIKKHGKD